MSATLGRYPAVLSWVSIGAATYVGAPTKGLHLPTEKRTDLSGDRLPTQKSGLHGSHDRLRF